MKEILFRAKRVNGREWVEGVPIQHSDGDWQIHGGFSNAGFLATVDPSTVCQYTGLTDKNGRKIFEGDCLGHKENIVEYLCGGFTVSGDRLLSMMAKYNEVVGNIFDKE